MIVARSCHQAAPAPRPDVVASVRERQPSFIRTLLTLHVDGAGLTSTALAISRLVRPTETRWSNLELTSRQPGFEPASRPKRRRVEWSFPPHVPPAWAAATVLQQTSPPHLAVNAMRSAIKRTEGLLVRVPTGGALRGAQPATRFAVLAPFISSRSSRKVFAHFSMSFSKTWRRITLIRRALLRGVSLMASSMASLRPLMS